MPRWNNPNCGFQKGNKIGSRFQLGNTFALGNTNKSGLGKRGTKTNHWKGGRFLAGGNRNYWYVYSPEHPYCTKDGYVMEHRLVIEAKLGRYLERTEFIHHINGDTKDNHPDNLQLVTKKQHARIHFDDCKKIADLEQQIALYKERFGVI